MRIKNRTAHVLVSLAATLPLAWPLQVAAQTYTATWASLDTHTPAPEWFQDAKFGIYYHWGAWCVAAYGSEWYPRNMYHTGSGEYNNHMSKYGDPFGAWGYDKFLTGANDKSGKFTQFAPKLKSQGGAWDPDEWAKMFADAGAKFAGPVAEHHDGFSMWDSKVNEWNSVLLGPKLNLAKYQADAIRKVGLKLIMSQHTAFNITGFYDKAPAASTTSLKKLYGQLPKAEGETLWLNKLKEMIDAFLPDIIWQDFNLHLISEANLTAFLAYYYNAAAAANKEVVATAKDGILAPRKGQVRDYERGGPADITTPYWLTDDAISSSSWSYTNGMAYYSTTALIHSFLDRVSKGGNLLLNVSPMMDGTFPQQQKDILAAFGKFLRQMGTAVYNTRTFAVYGEGPTKMGGGGMGAPSSMTVNDVRYTKSKDGDAVYALLMGWPGNGKQITLTAVTTSRFSLGTGKVFLFGPTGDGTGAIALQATQDASGLKITLPSTQPYTATAYAIKISKAGTEPAATPWTGISAPTGSDAGVPGTGGTKAPDAGIIATGGTTATGGNTGAGGTLVPTGGADAGAGGTGGIRATGGNTTVATGGANTTGGTAIVPIATGGVFGGGGTNTGGTMGATGGATARTGGATTGTGGSASGGSTTKGSGGDTSGTGGTIAASSDGCSCDVSGGSRGHASMALLGLGIAVTMGFRRRRNRR